MNRRKVVFTVEITGFKVHFEGDQTQGQDVSNQVAQGLAALANMPNHLLAAQDATNRLLPAPSETTNGESTEKKVKPKTSRSGKSPQTMIEAMVKDGFFDADRSAEDVATALNKKGHSYEAREVSTPLTRLTQKGILLREKKGEKSAYLYKKANVNGTGGS
jgi:hypothetical protein